VAVTKDEVTAPAAASELGKQLRPDRNHPDKQRNRCQRRRFLYKNLQHARLLICEHRGNTVLFLFLGQGAAMGQFEKRPLWLILDLSRYLQ
jgi:hypothetical protein